MKAYAKLYVAAALISVPLVPELVDILSRFPHEHIYHPNRLGRKNNRMIWSQTARVWDPDPGRKIAARGANHRATEVIR